MDNNPEHHYRPVAGIQIPKHLIAILVFASILFVSGCLAPHFGKGPCCDRTSATGTGPASCDLVDENGTHHGSMGLSMVYCAYADFDNVSNTTNYSVNYGGGRVSLNCENMTSDQANDKSNPCNNIGFCLMYNSSGGENVSYPICTQRTPDWEYPNCTAMLCGNLKYAPRRSFLPDVTKNTMFQYVAGSEGSIGLYNAMCQFYVLDAKTVRMLKKSKGVFQNTFRFGVGQSISDFEEARWYYPLSDRFIGLPSMFTDTTNDTRKDRFMNYLNLSASGTPAVTTNIPGTITTDQYLIMKVNYSARGAQLELMDVGCDGHCSPGAWQGHTVHQDTANAYPVDMSSGQAWYVIREIPGADSGVSFCFSGSGGGCTTYTGDGHTANQCVNPTGTPTDTGMWCDDNGVQTVNFLFSYTFPGMSAASCADPVQAPVWGDFFHQTHYACPFDPTTLTNYTACANNGSKVFGPLDSTGNYWFGTYTEVVDKYNNITQSFVMPDVDKYKFFLQAAYWKNNLPFSPGIYDSPTNMTAFECNDSTQCLAGYCSKEDFGYERGLCVDKTDPTKLINCMCHEVGTRMLTDNFVKCEPYKDSSSFEALTSHISSYDVLNDGEFCMANIPYFDDTGDSSGYATRTVFLPRNALDPAQVYTATSGALDQCCIATEGFKTMTCGAGTNISKAFACQNKSGNYNFTVTVKVCAEEENYSPDLTTPSPWPQQYNVCNLTTNEVGTHMSGDPSAEGPCADPGAIDATNYVFPQPTDNKLPMPNNAATRRSPLRGVITSVLPDNYDPESGGTFNGYFCCDRVKCLPVLNSGPFSGSGCATGEDGTCYATYNNEQVQEGTCVSLLHSDFCCLHENYTYKDMCNSGGIIPILPYSTCPPTPPGGFVKLPDTTPKDPLNYSHTSVCIPSESCAQGSKMCSFDAPHDNITIFTDRSDMCCGQNITVRTNVWPVFSTTYYYNECENVTPATTCDPGDGDPLIHINTNTTHVIVCRLSGNVSLAGDGGPPYGIAYSNCTIQLPPDGNCTGGSTNTVCKNVKEDVAQPITFIVKDTPYNFGQQSHKYDWGPYVGYYLGDDPSESMVVKKCGIPSSDVVDMQIPCPPYVINDTWTNLACLQSMKFNRHCTTPFCFGNKLVDMCVKAYTKVWGIKSLGNCAPDEGQYGNTMLAVPSFPKIAQTYGWCEGSTFDTLVGINLDDSYKQLVTDYMLNCPKTAQEQDSSEFGTMISSLFGGGCVDGEWGPVVGISDDYCGPSIRAYVADVKAMRDRVDHYLKAGAMPVVWFTQGSPTAGLRSGQYTMADDCRKIGDCGKMDTTCTQNLLTSGLNSVLTGAYFYYSPDNSQFFTSVAGTSHGTGCWIDEDKARTYSDKCPFIEAGSSPAGGESFISPQSGDAYGRSADLTCVPGWFSKKSVMDVKCDWNAQYPFLRRTIGNSASLVIASEGSPECGSARMTELKRQCPRCLFAHYIGDVSTSPGIINSLTSMDDISFNTAYNCYDAFVFDFQANTNQYIAPNSTEVYYSIFNNMSESSRALLEKSGKPSLVRLTINDKSGGAVALWTDYNSTLSFMRYAYSNQSLLVNSGIFALMYKDWAGGASALVDTPAHSTKDDKFCAVEQATDLYLNPLNKNLYYIKAEAQDSFQNSQPTSSPSAPECVQCTALELQFGQCSRSCMNLVDAGNNQVEPLNCTTDPTINLTEQKCPNVAVDNPENRCVQCTDLVDSAKYGKTITCDQQFMNGTNRTFQINDPTQVVLWPDAIAALPKGERCCFLGNENMSNYTYYKMSVDGLVTTPVIFPKSGDPSVDCGMANGKGKFCGFTMPVKDYNLDCWIQGGTGSASPSITLTSPNGNEIWAQGETHEIHWAIHGGLNASAALTITLINASSGLQVGNPLASGMTAGQGIYVWKINDTLPNGKYLINVTAVDVAGPYSDASDASFELGKLLTMQFITNGNLALEDFNNLTDNKTLIVFAHPGDDLMWMLPWWPNSKNLLLSAFPANTYQATAMNGISEFGYAGKLQKIPSDVGLAPYMNNWANSTGTGRLSINPADVANSIKSRVCNSGINRVITHGPNGEYGDPASTAVYSAVMSLVTSGDPSCKKDVWVLGIQVINSTLSAQYNDYAPSGTDYVKGNFDYASFHAARNSYLAQEASVDYSALQAAYQWWDPNKKIVWTWYTGDNEYPQGERTFYRVHKA